MVELIPLLFFLVVCLVLTAGYPVALSLTGVSLGFVAMGTLIGVFDTAYILLIPNRIYGLLVNQNLFAVPLFVFMGTMLERSRIAEDLLKNMAIVFGKFPGFLIILVNLEPWFFIWAGSFFIFRAFDSAYNAFFLVFTTFNLCLFLHLFGGDGRLLLSLGIPLLEVLLIVVTIAGKLTLIFSFSVAKIEKFFPIFLFELLFVIKLLNFLIEVAVEVQGNHEVSYK